MVILLKTASVRVSSIQIMQVRVQNKGKSVWKSRYVGDVSRRKAIGEEVARLLAAAPYRKTRWFLLSDFFLPESQYMELELASEGHQGAHEVGGRAPHPCGQGVGPLTLILSPVFFVNSEKVLRGFPGHSENFYFCTIITPWQFCWKQR